MKNYVLLYLILLLYSTSVIPQVKEEMRAVKLTNVDSNVLNSDQNIAEALDYLSSININVILPVMLNGGWTIYPSAVMDSLFGRDIHPNFTGRDPLKRLIIEAHRRGIEIYPWFEYGFAAWYSGLDGPANGGHILQTYPEWACKDQSGAIAKENGFDWMSAIDPDVQSFMNSLVQEVITKYDVDGVEFSDRIPAMPVKGGYEEASVSLYKLEHNGNEPPLNIHDADWKKWRAGKLNDWYRGVTQLVKNYDENIFVSASPSIYPWGYDNYLQDAKTWMDESITDHFIPQLYRYNYNGYLYELNQAVNQVGANVDRLFAGILMNVGTGSNAYLIDTDYLFQAIEANRSKGVMGEVYFYYEGFRKENGRLADTLRATYYSEPALVPLRNGKRWRPEGVIVNENDVSNNIIGEWEEYPMHGYEGKIFRTNNTDELYQIDYSFDVPAEGYYDLYYYFTPNTTWHDSTRVLIYSIDGVQQTSIKQNELAVKGWHKVGLCELQKGKRVVFSISNDGLDEGKYVVADAAMLMINRKLSPDVNLTGVGSISFIATPNNFNLSQNYPNPFNPTTLIEYELPLVETQQAVSLRIYDILGRLVATLVNTKQKPGSYKVEWDASKHASGVYLYKLQTTNYIQTRKMILLK